MEEDQDYFLVQYWRERGFARISDMPGKSHLIDQNIPPEVLAVDMIREAGESERAYQNYNPYARLKTVFPDKAVLKTGVDTSSAGILSNPALSSWSADSEPLLLSTVFDVLLKDNPELEHLLTMSGLNYGVPHHYYMAYMHNLLIFSEFIAIASLLEQMNGMNETWILSNMQPLSVDSEGDRSLLALNGIRDVVVKDLNNNESRYYTTGLESGRKVNVVLLPPIVNDLDYASLFAKSRQPVGVTGNSSLFLAIALRKLPIYDINVPFHYEVNHNLAQFDSSGHLQAILSNVIAPEEKAMAIKRLEGTSVVHDWSENILTKKQANEALLKIVEWSTSNKNR